VRLSLLLELALELGEAIVSCCSKLVKVMFGSIFQVLTAIGLNAVSGRSAVVDCGTHDCIDKCGRRV
jgi:hypothetical protein